MHGQGITPEEQQAALDKKLQQSQGDYVLPTETKVVHEGKAVPQPNIEAHVIPEPIEEPYVTPPPPDTVLAPESNFNDPGLPPLKEPPATPTAAINSNVDLKSQIRELEEKLGGGVDLASDQVAQTFMDSTGQETFYVKNVSGSHVVISDIKMDKIKVGTAVDLLRHASLEDLKKSRDLRVALGGIGKDKWLHRLTEAQYLEEKRMEYANKQKVDAMRRQESMRVNSQAQNQQAEPLPHERTPQMRTANRIRPVIEAKLGKLSLRDDPNPENAMLAMTAIEFVQWVQAENLNHVEIDHMLGHPVVARDQSIRVALLEKKRQTPPS